MIGYRYRQVRTVSRGVSLRIGQNVLRLFRLCNVPAGPVAPIRRFVRRARLLRSNHAANLQASFAERRQTILALNNQKLRGIITNPHQAVKLSTIQPQMGSSAAKAIGSARTNSGREWWKDLAVSHAYRISQDAKLAKLNEKAPIGFRNKITSVFRRMAPASGTRLLNLRQAMVNSTGLRNRHTEVLKPYLNTQITLARGKTSRKSEWRADVASLQLGNKRKIKFRKLLKFLGESFEDSQSLAPKPIIKGSKNTDSQYNQIQNHLMHLSSSNQSSHYDQHQFSNFKLEKMHLRHVVNELITVDARRPPSGAATFDARSAPIWPGRKPAF